MVDPVAKRLGHETRDVHVRVIAWSALGLVVAAVIAYLAVAGLYKLFAHQHPSPDAPSRIEFYPHTIVPPPLLEIHPVADLEQLQTAEEGQLHSYGWVDKPAGVIRIPIERAMDLVVQRGLPTRGPGTQDASNKTAIQMQQDKAAATKP